MANDANAAPSSSEQFADAVVLLVERATLRREQAGGNGAAGPLTPQELQELSFFCTAQDCAAAGSDGVGNSGGGGFAGVEGDSLVTLIELLDQHVNQAVTVHLIEAAIAVHQAAGGSPSQANAAIDKVRLEFAGLCLFLAASRKKELALLEASRERDQFTASDYHCTIL